jgi:hypothetical protein
MELEETAGKVYCPEGHEIDRNTYDWTRKIIEESSDKSSPNIMCVGCGHGYKISELKEE